MFFDSSGFVLYTCWKHTVERRSAPCLGWHVVVFFVKWLCLLGLWFVPDQIGRNPGLQGIWEDEKQRRRENNQTSQIESPDSQGERSFFDFLFFVLILMCQQALLLCAIWSICDGFSKCVWTKNWCCKNPLIKILIMFERKRLLLQTHVRFLQTFIF